MTEFGKYKNKQKNKQENKQNGSVMILTLMAVLILSIMVSGLLEVGSQEIYSTRNYQLQKTAYYKAVEGVEEIRNLVYNYPDAQSVTSIKRYSTNLEGPTLPEDVATNGTGTTDGNLKLFYITGSLKDMEIFQTTSSATDIKYIEQLESFEPPPLPSISLGGSAAVSPVVWKVNVTSEVKLGSQKSYAEINSGVYSILTIAY